MLVNPSGAAATPLRYRKLDGSPRSRRTEYEPGSRVGTVVTVAGSIVEGVRGRFSFVLL